MSEVGSSFRSFLNVLNPYHSRGSVKSFIDDVRKEGVIKPVFYGLAVGAGVFDATSKIGKHVIRQPIENFILTPTKRIMGLEKPNKQPFKNQIIEVIQSPEVTFGLSAGVGTALAFTGLYGMHHLFQNMIQGHARTKDHENDKI